MPASASHGSGLVPGKRAQGPTSITTRPAWAPLGALSLYSPQRAEALSSGPQHLGLVFCWLVSVSSSSQGRMAWLSVRGGNNLNGGG